MVLQLVVAGHIFCSVVFCGCIFPLPLLSPCPSRHRSHRKLALLYDLYPPSPAFPFTEALPSPRSDSIHPPSSNTCPHTHTHTHSWTSYSRLSRGAAVCQRSCVCGYHIYPPRVHFKPSILPSIHPSTPHPHHIHPPTHPPINPSDSIPFVGPPSYDSPPLNATSVVLLLGTVIQVNACWLEQNRACSLVSVSQSVSAARRPSLRPSLPLPPFAFSLRHRCLARPSSITPPGRHQNQTLQAPVTHSTPKPACRGDQKPNTRPSPLSPFSPSNSSTTP